MYKCKDIVLLELNLTIYLIMQINIYNRIGHQAMTILVLSPRIKVTTDNSVSFELYKNNSYRI